MPAVRVQALRVVLAINGLTATVLGGWATFGPRQFYDDFPGGGRHWIRVDGPYNEHLVRDFGGLQLALAIMTVVALVTLSPLIVRTAALAGLAFAVPHLAYHLRHLHVYASSDKVLNAVSLSGAVALGVAALLLSGVPVAPTPTGGRAPTGGAEARSGS